MNDIRQGHELTPEGIETRRLRIRRFLPSDIDDLLAVVSHPSVAAETPNIPHDSEGLAEYVDQQNRLALFEPHACVDFAIERKSDQRVIGLVTVVSNGNRQGEIGWGIGIDYRSHGFATEAAQGLISYLFDAHNYHRIFAGTIYTNTASWAVMERLGMRKEAHFIKAHPPTMPEGPWIDTVRYAVLAEDWVDGRRIEKQGVPTS
ncbi:GNAT family N-acetyltransferase [Candidatus Bipolaricaulota bacterium]|nr:GNAT family N-acetyltransferase [Candidatus Bipolaricaulota bacterium]